MEDVEPQVPTQPIIFSEFEFLPIKIVEKILWSLSIEDKKRARRTCKAWNGVIVEKLSFTVPPFNDCTRDALCNFTQPLTSLRVTSFILSTPMLIKLSNGHRIHRLQFEDPQVSEDNLIWLMTKCYSVKEIEFIQGQAGEASQRRLCEFLSSRNVKIINMASRTLKSIKIIGQDSEPRDLSKYAFDCSVLRDCASLQSLLVLGMPFLQLKDIQKLPSALGYLALEVQEDGDSPKELGHNRKLINLGFIDFSCPITVQTFQYIIRLPRLKRATMCPITGQNILDICQTVRIFSAEWSPVLNHYQLKVESKPYKPSAPETEICS